MSIASELTNLRTNINNAYTTIGDKGGTVPAQKTTLGLSSAIDTISSGSDYDFDISYYGPDAFTLSSATINGSSVVSSSELIRTKFYSLPTPDINFNNNRLYHTYGIEKAGDDSYTLGTIGSGGEMGQQQIIVVYESGVSANYLLENYGIDVAGKVYDYETVPLVIQLQLNDNPVETEATDCQLVFFPGGNLAIYATGGFSNYKTQIPQYFITRLKTKRAINTVLSFSFSYYLKYLELNHDWNTYNTTRGNFSFLSYASNLEEIKLNSGKFNTYVRFPFTGTINTANCFRQSGAYTGAGIKLTGESSLVSQFMSQFPNNQWRKFYNGN